MIGVNGKVVLTIATTEPNALPRLGLLARRRALRRGLCLILRLILCLILCLILWLTLCLILRLILRLILCLTPGLLLQWVFPATLWLNLSLPRGLSRRRTDSARHRGAQQQASPQTR